MQHLLKIYIKKSKYYRWFGILSAFEEGCMSNAYSKYWLNRSFGKLGIVLNIAYTDPQISKVYVKFDDQLVGNRLMGSDFCCNLHQVVPVDRVESRISLSRKNNFDKFACN